MSTALILSGGGARAAYQVGVLKGLAHLIPTMAASPFQIICGTSAGAINTLALAGKEGDYRRRVASMEAMWRELGAEKIYRTDFLGVLGNSLRLFLALFHSGYGRSRALSLLDNSPLRALLRDYIEFREIDEAIAAGRLEAVALTAMSYSTGQSVTFFQGNHDNWIRARRMGLRTGLTMEHLMASAAIPTLFPPVRIGNRYFGDGALRQLKPLSPALHLGASRLFIIGVSDNIRHKHAAEVNYHSPSLAQMAGHMLNSAFIDTIESDIETLQAINRLTSLLSAEEREAAGVSDMKPVDYLCITPSLPINELADEYIHELPRSVRMFLRATGATARGGGSSAASYLLFEPGFCGRLIDMGYDDTLRQEERVLRFFDVEKATAARDPVQAGAALE